MSKPRLRNLVSGERQRALSLACLREPGVTPQLYGDAEDPYRLLDRLGFDRLEAEYLFAFHVEGYRLADLPQRLACDPAEVERRRKRIERKIFRIRFERASKKQ